MAHKTSVKPIIALAPAMRANKISAIAYPSKHGGWKSGSFCMPPPQ
ncbi:MULTISPECIES: hypothetical protein [Bradyrhizobium]|uniref:Uncharacterized protein n=1 Tax=Bradyrhizobium brasilense TaxID=1419277 RepID=A0ABY8JRW3_9BRAD|nr:hypothetical protein [Bradyrhizobium brasilense]WFU66813.1 hypothetical protein QA636_15495 [Bradyrhizobium brasilense]